MTPPPHSAPSRLGRCAFSLVEIILAVGLVTFAVLVLFALLPVGLNSLGDANRQIIETEILNTVGAELSSTAFDQLDNYQSSRYPIYFNNEGSEVKAADSPVYIVRCQIAPLEPGDQLRRAVVQIGFHVDPNSAASANLVKRPFLIVKKE